MLAVMEHVPPDEQPKVAAAGLRPAPAGRPVHPDGAVAGGRHASSTCSIRLRLLHGMEADQHYGFEPDDLEPVGTAAGFRLLVRSTFQARLNNLFVFERPR